jgi:hypothetical protein
MRRFRRRGGEQFVVHLKDETTLAVPAWMLDPILCARLMVESRPRLAYESLRELRRLIVSHPLSRTGDVVSIDDSSSPSGERHEEFPSRDEVPAPTAPAAPIHRRSS